MAASSATFCVYDIEKQPSSPSLPRDARTRAHLTAPIRSSLSTELLLILLTIMTGIQDATTFPDYHCFASNQTGNTIFLTLAVVLPELNGKMFVTSNIGVALAFFLVANWLTGQIANVFQLQRTRIWLVGCNMLQSLLVFIAATVQWKYGTSMSGTPTLVTVGLLAFASGSQVVQSRALSTPEISTAMATAAWVDLLIDPKLFQVHGTNRGRNRRIGFILALVTGGFMGATIYRFAGSPTAILVSAVGKLLVAIAYLLAPAETQSSTCAAISCKSDLASESDHAPQFEHGKVADGPPRN